MTTYTGIKFKVETSAKEKYQQLLDFITIDILKIEQHHNYSEDIMELSKNPIINRSFNKHPMSWELIHRRLLHPCESVMKAMCRNQTIDGLPKIFPRKYTKHHAQSSTQQKRQLQKKEHQLTPVTFNQENLLTWTLNFTTSISYVVSPP